MHFRVGIKKGTFPSNLKLHVGPEDELRGRLVSVDSAAKPGKIWDKWEKVEWLCAPAPPRSLVLCTSTGIHN